MSFAQGTIVATITNDYKVTFMADAMPGATQWSAEVNVSGQAYPLSDRELIPDPFMAEFDLPGYGIIMPPSGTITLGVAQFDEVDTMLGVGIATIQLPVQPVPPPADPFRPETREVAIFILNRTVFQNEYLGDFTSGTACPKDVVEDLIDQAEQFVLTALQYNPDADPPSIPEYNVPDVRSLIALLAAILVELTKFSEQIARQVSPYPYLKEVFDGMLAQKQNELGIMPPSDGSSALTLVDLIAREFGQAIYAFPDDEMVNWETVF